MVDVESGGVRREPRRPPPPDPEFTRLDSQERARGGLGELLGQVLTRLLRDDPKAGLSLLGPLIAQIIGPKLGPSLMGGMPPGMPPGMAPPGGLPIGQTGQPGMPGPMPPMMGAGPMM